MWGPFEEKKGGGFSMKRLVVFMVATSLCVRMVRAEHFGWPEAVVGVFVCLAVGVQVWLETKGGHDSLEKAIGLISAKLTGGKA